MRPPEANIVLNERIIKAAVVDRLFRAGALKDAVLINEMVIANWSRRVDLAVANGHLHAFEIKSDLDTLRRLTGQVATYLDRFDKVTVVTTSKFVKIVRDQTDDRVEVWEAAETRGIITLKVVRRGRSRDVVNTRMLCSYLLKPELVTLLMAHGYYETTSTPRETLLSLAESLPIRALRKFTLEALKMRYRKTFDAFQQRRTSNTKPEDLMLLSKARLNAHTLIHTTVLEPLLPKNARRVDLAALRKKYGPLPENMPELVLKRSAA